jgi:hypothetical protein
VQPFEDRFYPRAEKFMHKSDAHQPEAIACGEFEFLVETA